MTMRDEVKPVECDCCGGTWGYINADGDHDNVYECVTTLTQQRDEARRERDQFASMLHDCEQEREGWKHRAEQAERERDALQQEVYQAADLNNGDNGFNASWTYAELYHKEWARANSAEHRAERMARVVEALREPSEEVVLHAAEVFGGHRNFYGTEEQIDIVIRAAVAAAEREVTP